MQNNLAELWALLHFVMPSLFDSHEHFSDWFSKGIEGSVKDNKIDRQNELQLKRLHSVLQPFVLRRVKKDVEAEMPKKIEVKVKVDMSSRQKSPRSAFDPAAHFVARNQRPSLGVQRCCTREHLACTPPARRWTTSRRAKSGCGTSRTLTR